MTKDEAMGKVKEMVADVPEYLIHEAERLLNSGGVNPPDYLNNYVLPKIVLTVALENCAFQYRPPQWNDSIDAEICNLRHF